MQSRAARLTLGAAAWIALAAAAFFIITSEQSLSNRRAALHRFNDGVVRATSALSDARAGLKAYVAVGQSAPAWMPKVDALVKDVNSTVDQLRELAVSIEARRALLNVSVAASEFTAIDTRVRDYVRVDEMLMAGDVAFSEGDEAAKRGAAGLETARVQEQQAFDAEEGASRLRAAYAAAAAALFTGLVLVAFLFTGGASNEDIAEMRAKDSADVATRLVEDLDFGPLQPAKRMPAEKISSAEPIAAAPGVGAPALKEVAELCTSLSLMTEAGDLQALVARAARLLNAGGVVVWLGDSAGADLRPIVGHGYSDQVLALMRTVPRMADNATAAAYRSGLIQVVPSAAGGAGALVVPLLSAEGCVGALTAEMRDGKESSAQLQAIATIVAAQLSSALAPAVSAGASIPLARTASA